jgi:mannose/fructose/N-acetylgalactosamine-specific phosphotransferase system component IIB
VGWRQHLRYAEIWVVDDLVLADPYLQDALRLAAPSGVEVRVYRVEEAGALLAPSVAPRLLGRETSPTVCGGGGGARDVLLLVRSPGAALALVEGGVPLSQVNVGNVSARPGSVRVFKNISLTPAQAEALDALAGRGVQITFQLTPEDPQVDWPVVRRRIDR